ncbi:MAG: restriction endonuclease, partial [Acidimicrobiia bacterium]
MNGTLSQLLDKLSPDNDIRGKQFEPICKWFLETDLAYRSQLKRVWLWDDWPGRWGPDAGIDLVAETHAGDSWAIQAKCYKPEESVTKDDMNTFLSESARAVFSYRLLIATTNRIGVTARRTVEAQEKPVGLLMRSDLDKAKVKWPTSPTTLRGAVPKPKKPRPHQRQAMKAVIGGFVEGDRGQLIMACG